MPNEYEFELPLKTEAELRMFIDICFGVHIPDVQVCPNHSTPWRAFCDAYFARSSVAVWEGSRGLAGKTFLLSMLALTEALTLKINVNLLGGSGEQSTRVLEHMNTFWHYENAPKEMLRGEVARETRIGWGNEVKALMASQTSVRGPHPVRLAVDEVDLVELPILDAALGQPMPAKGVATHVVQSSTHQFADGTMTECIRRALADGQPYFRWCYRESMGTGDFDWVRDIDPLSGRPKWRIQLRPGATPSGWLTPETCASMRNQMTVAMWDNEVELGEPSPETRAIQPISVARMFHREWGEWEGGIRQDIRFEQPDLHATYAHGADWAKKQDRTILITLRTDVRPIRLVAFMALQREEWPIMVGEFAQRLRDYPGTAVFDATGLGDVVADILKQEQVGALPFLMTGKQRAALLSNYIRGIEAGELVAPFIRLMEGEHRLASVADVYQSTDKSGASHHLPDTIAAGALAWHGARMITNVDEWIAAMRDPNSMINQVVAQMAQGAESLGVQVERNDLGKMSAEEWMRLAPPEQMARIMGIPELGKPLPRESRGRPFGVTARPPRRK